MEKTRVGYQYLLAYKITVPIYDYTIEFCKRWIDYHSRTKDQMEQAARSGMQNILEGSKEESLKMYIKLTGVARASLEELLNDYLSYARQNKIGVYPKDKSIGKIGEIGKIWEIIRGNAVLPDSPNFPNLPNKPEIAVNLMITIINQANYLQDKLILSLKEKHMKEGGLTEELYRKRVEYRKNH